MLSIGLKNLLEQLELYSNHAVFFSNQDDGPSYKFPLETEKKLQLINPNAVYIFNSQPYILFFDLEDNLDQLRESEIHKQVWSFDNAPLIFILKKGDIEIYNAFSYNKKTSRLQKIAASPDEQRQIFSFWNLQSGNTWTWLDENYYKTSIKKKRVNQKLFENIQSVRERLTTIIQNTPLTENDSNILILRLIFIRYLIDRDVKINSDYISGGTVLARRRSFSNLIGDPVKLNNFFSFLNEKFNGVLFKNAEIKLSTAQASFLAAVFNESGDGQQIGLFDDTDYYFDVFDFSIIPVEVISGIYESLLSPETKKLHSAIYTPSFLVEYILCDTIDRYHEKSNIAECKIFDPSCGSGIFLVQAYRRMIDREKTLYGEKISKPRLRQIAENNLFGIDINEQALKVSCFSIYIAILDYQDPKTILDNFKFPDLIGNNLFVADFFDQDALSPLNQTIKRLNFKFILGNPPWKKDNSQKHLSWVNENKIYKNKTDGGLEIAQSFLLRSKEFMNPDTTAVLIVTSMAFYNVSSTTKEFKRKFLSGFYLDKFFDLSPVRRLVFEEKTSPASVVYYRSANFENTSNNIVDHSSIKTNIFLKYFKTLVIEKFDQKRIPQAHFFENDWMFKVALYGNVLDYAFIKRLEQSKKKLLDIFDGKEIFKGAGIVKGTKDKFSSFPIIGKPVIENDDLIPYYSKAASNKAFSQGESYIKSGRELGLYDGLQILIKEQAKNESELVVSLVDKSYVFRKGVFSLTTVNHKNELNYIYSILISRLYEYFIFITSGSWGVSTRPQIRLDDEYLSFPLKYPAGETFETLLDQVEFFIEPLKKFYGKFNLGQFPVNYEALSRINEIIESVYGIVKYERDLIDYVLTVCRYQFQESKQDKFNKKLAPDSVFLRSYAEIFLKEFRSIYQDEFISAQIYSLQYFIAINFVLSKDKPEADIVFINDVNNESQVLSKLSQRLSISKITSCTDTAKNLYIQKDIKGFEINSFYIIKPNEIKCWHRAMAWYDLAEIKEAIEAAELKHLKNN